MLKKEIANKRLHLEKELQIELQNEISMEFTKHDRIKQDEVRIKSPSAPKK